MQLQEDRILGQKDDTNCGGHILPMAYFFCFVIPADIALILLG